MVYIKYEENGKPTGTLYHGTYADALKWVFSHGLRGAQMIVFRLKGYDYRSYQRSLRTLAINFQMLDEGGLSYGEIAEIQDFFRTYGKRYGLLRDFRENGIC